MKTIAQTAPSGRLTDMIGGLIALITVGLLLAFAEANGAVTITTVTQAEVNGILATTVGSGSARVGNGSAAVDNFHEVVLTGTGTDPRHYNWKPPSTPSATLGLPDFGASITNTAFNFSVINGQMRIEFGPSGSTQLIPVTGSYNTLYVYLASATNAGSTISFNGITGNDGAGSQAIGGLTASGTAFSGFKVNFTGDDMTVAGTLSFARQEGFFSTASMNEQSLNFKLVQTVPEPASALLLVIGSLLSLRRRR